MCVLIAKPRGVDLPSSGALDACEFSNRDGAGVAWENGSKVFIKKDFANLKELKRWLADNPMRDNAMLIHFRLATSGGKRVGLRHPFPISAREDELLAPVLETDSAMGHNGVLWTPGKGERLSDTAMLVRDILADTVVKDSLRTNIPLQMLLTGTIGESNKLAFLYPDGHILTFGEFEKDNGILYSNGQYKAFQYAGGDDSFGYGDYAYNRGGKFWRFDRASRKRREVDWCAICYQEESVDKMYKSTFEDIEGEMVCGKCNRVLNAPKQLPAPETDGEFVEVEGEVYTTCYMCQEIIGQEDQASTFSVQGEERTVCVQCAVVDEVSNA